VAQAECLQVVCLQVECLQVECPQVVCLQAELDQVDQAECLQAVCLQVECLLALDPKVLAETQATCSATLCRSDQRIKFVSDTYKLTKVKPTFAVPSFL